MVTKMIEWGTNAYQPIKDITVGSIPVPTLRLILHELGLMYRTGPFSVGRISFRNTPSGFNSVISEFSRSDMSKPMRWHIDFVIHGLCDRVDDRAVLCTPFLRSYSASNTGCWVCKDLKDAMHGLIVLTSPVFDQHPSIEIEHGYRASLNTSSTGIVSIPLTPGRIILHPTTLPYRIVYNSTDKTDYANALISAEVYIW